MGRRRKSSQSDEESKKENRMDKATVSFSLKNAATANARERARMQVLSKAFVKLKTTLPWVPPDTKLSKLDTLRLATSYIAHLRQILAEDDEAASEMQDASDCASGSGASGGNGSLLSARQQPSGGGADSAGSGGSAAASPTHVTSPTAAAVHPINFTWPYSFHGRVTTTATPEVIEVKPQLPCSATS